MPAKSANPKSFASFWINGQLFGLDILLIREINRQLDMTMAPRAQSHVRGLVNLRGQIVTVLDLKQILGMGQTDMTDKTHNLVLKTQAELNAVQVAPNLAMNDKMSLLIDDIGDVISVEEHRIEPPPANIGPVDGKYLSGVVQLDTQLMAILSSHHILIEP